MDCYSLLLLTSLSHIQVRKKLISSRPYPCEVSIGTLQLTFNFARKCFCFVLYLCSISTPFGLELLGFFPQLYIGRFEVIYPLYNFFVLRLEGFKEVGSCVILISETR